MAARLKLTEDVQKRICDAIGMGATYELAAKYGGVAYETFRRWRESNHAFCAAVQDAEGRAAVGWLAKIERAANDGAWQAAAWKLERRYPQDYGKTVQATELSGPSGAPLEVGIREIVVRLPVAPAKAELGPGEPT